MIGFSGGRWLPLLLVGVLCAPLFTGCKSADFVPKRTIVVEGFSSPESVIPGPGYMLVSNVGEKLEPSVKDGDGFISAVLPDGTVLNRRFLPVTGVLNAPKGMAIVGTTLYVADIDRVVGFNLETRERVFELDFSGEGTVFLNDLTVKDERTLFVSATDIAQVFRVDLQKKTYTPISRKIPGANGLFYEKSTYRLFVVGYSGGPRSGGGIWVVDYSRDGERVEMLLGDVGALDGLAKTRSEMLVISDWVAADRAGRIFSYNLLTGALKNLDLDLKVMGPADFHYDERSGVMWLPMMPEGKVAIIPLG